MSEQKLLQSLKRILTNPLPMKDIILRLEVKRNERHKVKRKIRDLAESGEIVRIKGNRYGLPDKMSLVTGTIQGHRDGYGFVIPDEPGQTDLFLGARSFGGAMHGDRVVCRVEGVSGDGKREGKVIRVLERAHETIAGRFETFSGGGYVVPFEKRIAHDLFVPYGQSMGAKDGQAVIAEVVEYPSKTRNSQGSVIRILGDPNDPEVEIHIVAAKFHLRSDFPPAAVDEARAAKPPRKADIEGRLDLRDKTIVTIDGETAKDFDDAVEVERIRGGNWRLSVSIADVAQYVKEGSALDKEAALRGVSVYFPGTVTPMLPFDLSNEVCSLNPRVDRLTLSCIMTIDPSGEVVSSQIRESVIRTVERMTYTDVAAILDGGDPELMKRYEGLVDKFQDMAELADILNRRRQANGAIDFDLPEPEVILDITGRPENIIRAERNVAHRIVEEFMLLANQTVARRLVKRGLPALHRVHDKPDPMKIEAFKEFMDAFGYRFAKNEEVTSARLQQILAHATGRPEEKLITHVMLRSMKQARYSNEPLGHFALGFEHYTHFTSPIRRYPDLIIHRILKDMIRKERRDDHWNELLPKIAGSCSAAERNAEDAERDIIKLKQTQYMAGRIGEEFDGLISGVTAFGFFVEISEPAVEGLVRLTNLHDDYYIYREADHLLEGDRTGKLFRLGDPVRVSVADVSVEQRQIDFEWIDEGGEKTRRRKSKSTPKRPVKRTKTLKRKSKRK